MVSAADADRSAASRARSRPWGLVARLVLLTLLFGFIGRTWGDPPAATPAAPQAEAALGRLDQIAQTLQHGSPSADQLAALTDEVSSAQGKAQDCIGAQESESAALAEKRKALGPAVSGESAQAAEARAQLEQQQAQVTALLSNCRLLQVKSSDLLQALQARQGNQLLTRLLTRGPATPSIFQAWIAQTPTPGSLFDLQSLRQRLGAADADVMLWLGALGLIGLALGMTPRHWMRQAVWHWA